MSELLYLFIYFFFFKQKTAYEMRISVWSSDVCSSDLASLERTMAILACQIEDNRERLAEQIDTLMAMGDGVASRLGTLRDDAEQEIESVSRHRHHAATSTDSATNSLPTTFASPPPQPSAPHETTDTINQLATHHG